MLLLAGCGSTVSPLPYAPTVTPVAGSGMVQMGAATDNRANRDATYYGTIRGGLGNPLKTLRTDIPIASVVAKPMSETIDHIVDDPAFRRAVGGTGARIG